MDIVHKFLSLPHDIIIDILSRVDKKERVRFCTLAESWKNLWLKIPVCLEFCEGSSTDIFKFFSGMLEELHYWRQGTIQEVKLLLKSFEPRTANLLHFVIWFVYTFCVERFNLTFLDINFSDEAYVASQLLFSSAGLLELETSNVMLNPTGRVKWESLNFLSIGRICISQEAINQMLSGAPNLTSLTLDRVNGFPNLRIRSKKLLKLIVVCYDQNPHNLNISAPFLVSLELRGTGYYTDPWILTEVGSLKTGILFFSLDFIGIEEPWLKQETEYNSFSQIFERFHGVQQLELGPWTTKCISSMRFGGFQSTALKFVRFTASKRLSRHHGILSLLSRCTRMDTLCIDWHNDPWEFYPLQQYTSYHFPVLRRIELKDIFTGRHINNNVTQLLMCVLRDAPSLDKLVITGQYRANEEARYHEFLQTLRRASPNLKIEYLTS